MTDLAGLSPIADGQPPGTLGQFDVPPPSAPRSPFDYGALLPDRASSGVRFEGTAAPGQSTDLPFRGDRARNVHAHGGADRASRSSIQIVGRDVDRSLDPTGTNDTNSPPASTRSYTEISRHEVTPFSLTLRLAISRTEMVLSNGVGQGPALSLRLISFPGAVMAFSPPSGPIPRTHPARPRSPWQRRRSSRPGQRRPASPPARARFDGMEGISPTDPARRRILPRPDDGHGRPSDRCDSLHRVPRGLALARYGTRRRSAWFSRGCCVSRSHPGRSARDPNGPTLSDMVPGHESKIRPAQAGMVQFGLRRGIEGGQWLGTMGHPSGGRASVPGSCRGPTATAYPTRESSSPSSATDFRDGPPPGWGPGRPARRLAE